MITLYIIPESIAQKNPGLTEERIHTTRDFFLLSEWLDEEPKVVEMRDDLLEKLPTLKDLLPDSSFTVVDSFEDQKVPVESSVKAVVQLITMDELERKLHKGLNNEEHEEKADADEVSVPGIEEAGSEV